MHTLIQRKAFLFLLAVVTIAFVWLLLPYYSAVLWAVILAIIFRPMQRGLERRLKGRRTPAALISVLICIFIVIIPASAIVGSLIQEGASLYQRVRSGEIDFNAYIAQFQAVLPPTLEEWMVRVGIGDFAELRQRLSSAAMEGSQMVAGQALSLGQSTLQFLVSLGIMLYLLFFLFRDGRSLGRNIRASIPLSDDYTRQLISKFTAVVRATVKGNVIIAAIQGAIGGVTFWLLGIEAALLWGVLMAFLSLLPAIGAAVVWLPVAAYLLLTGDYVRGAILVFIGVVVIGLVDNLLRPPLVGKETRLPDYVVLISTVGGMTMFGINGFVIGPLIAALFISAWALFKAEQEQAQKDADEPPAQ